MTKPVIFLGTALGDLRDFPRAARREAGFQLDKLQHGHEPDDWKPMADLGAGLCEVRIRDEAGIFRVVYCAKFVEGIYVLHAFQKKSQQTAARDIKLIVNRFKDLMRQRS